MGGSATSVSSVASAEGAEEGRDEDSTAPGSSAPDAPASTPATAAAASAAAAQGISVTIVGSGSTQLLAPTLPRGSEALDSSSASCCWLWFWLRLWLTTSSSELLPGVERELRPATVSGDMVLLSRGPATLAVVEEEVEEEEEGVEEGVRGTAAAANSTSRCALRLGFCLPRRDGRRLLGGV